MTAFRAFSSIIRIVEASLGGLVMRERSLNVKNDMRFAADTHQRWMIRRNRRQEAPDYKEGWWGQQCGHCRYWVPLSGALGSDYGACTNERSLFDGIVRFEHDGCDAFHSAESWIQPDE